MIAEVLCMALMQLGANALTPPDELDHRVARAISVIHVDPVGGSECKIEGNFLLYKSASCLFRLDLSEASQNKGAVFQIYYNNDGDVYVWSELGAITKYNCGTEVCTSHVADGLSAETLRYVRSASRARGMRSLFARSFVFGELSSKYVAMRMPTGYRVVYDLNAGRVLSTQQSEELCRSKADQLAQVENSWILGMIAMRVWGLAVLGELSCMETTRVNWPVRKLDMDSSRSRIDATDMDLRLAVLYAGQDRLAKARQCIALLQCVRQWTESGGAVVDWDDSDSGVSACSYANDEFARIVHLTSRRLDVDISVSSPVHLSRLGRDLPRKSCSVRDTTAQLQGLDIQIKSGMTPMDVYSILGDPDEMVSACTWMYNITGADPYSLRVSFDNGAVSVVGRLPARWLQGLHNDGIVLPFHVR